MKEAVKTYASISFVAKLYMIIRFSEMCVPPLPLVTGASSSAESVPAGVELRGNRLVEPTTTSRAQLGVTAKSVGRMVAGPHVSRRRPSMFCLIVKSDTTGYLAAKYAPIL